jgi:site-specific DNA-methyltransferase (adenine-specific)
MVDIKLYLGDCLEVMKDIPPKSVDAIITDLPYGTIACQWDVVIPFDEMWKLSNNINKGVFVTTSSQPFTSMIICSNIKEFKYEWIWEKTKATGYPMAKIRPMKAHENILVFGSANYNPQMEKGKPYKQPRKKQNYDKTMNGAFKVRKEGYIFEDNNGTRYPRSVITFRNSYYDDGEQVHPTQKPVSLYEYLVRTYTNEGGTVLDITMGSGTTGVSCVKTGRNFIGIEKDPVYFAIAEKRIKEAQMQPNLFESERE